MDRNRFGLTLADVLSIARNRAVPANPHSGEIAVSGLLPVAGMRLARHLGKMYSNSLKYWTRALL